MDVGGWLVEKFEKVASHDAAKQAAGVIRPLFKANPMLPKQWQDSINKFLTPERLSKIGENLANYGLDFIDIFTDIKKDIAKELDIPDDATLDRMRKAIDEVADSYSAAVAKLNEFTPEETRYGEYYARDTAANPRGTASTDWIGDKARYQKDLDNHNRGVESRNSARIKELQGAVDSSAAKLKEKQEQYNAAYQKRLEFDTNSAHKIINKD